VFGWDPCPLCGTCHGFAPNNHGGALHAEGDERILMQKMSRDRLVGVQARGALRGFAALGAELLAEVSDSCHASQPARPPASPPAVDSQSWATDRLGTSSCSSCV
jgi:hypothetical protein